MRCVAVPVGTGRESPRRDPRDVAGAGRGCPILLPSHFLDAGLSPRCSASRVVDMVSVLCHCF